MFFSDNQAAWERYEQKRDELFKKLDGADTELENINQVQTHFVGFAFSKKLFGSKLSED